MWTHVKLTHNKEKMCLFGGLHRKPVIIDVCNISYKRGEMFLGVLSEETFREE